MGTHITKHADAVAFTSEGSMQKKKPQGDDGVMGKIAFYEVRKITERLET